MRSTFVAWAAPCGASDTHGLFPNRYPRRVRDAAAVAGYIRNITGRVPVVIGWSQGGLITGLLAASDRQHQLAAGVDCYPRPRVALSYHKTYSGRAEDTIFPIPRGFGAHAIRN